MDTSNFTDLNTDTCRLCMSSGAVINLLTEENSIITAQILTCTDIHVHTEDGLPSSICKRCKKKIRKFYTFKHECQYVENELREMVKNKLSLEQDTKAIEIIDVPIEKDSNIEEYEEKNINENVNDQNFKNLQIEDVLSQSLDSLLDSDLLQFEFMNDSINKDDDFIDGQTLYNYISGEIPDFGNQNEKSLNTDTTPLLLCEECGCEFKTKMEFKKHSRSHKNSKMFLCKYCPKTFKRSYVCNLHMRTHTGERPYLCGMCGYAALAYKDLARHAKIHSEERNYACRKCGRRFKRPGDISSHMRTHTGERPYKCHLCKKDYTSHSGLRKHLKTHNSRS